MRRHRGSKEDIAEAAEEDIAATADSATTQAKGASIRPLVGVFTTILARSVADTHQGRVSGAAKADTQR